GKVAEHPVQLLGVYLETHPPALDGEAVDPGELAEARDRLGELRLDGGAGEVAKLGQSPALDRLAVADDRDPITQGLDLGEDMAGQKHRPAALALCLDALAEGGFHQRVEPGGRLI